MTKRTRVPPGVPLTPAARTCMKELRSCKRGNAECARAFDACMGGVGRRGLGAAKRGRAPSRSKVSMHKSARHTFRLVPAQLDMDGSWHEKVPLRKRDDDVWVVRSHPSNTPIAVVRNDGGDWDLRRIRNGGKKASASIAAEGVSLDAVLDKALG